MTNDAADLRVLNAIAPGGSRLPRWARTTILVVGMAVAMLGANAIASSIQNPVAALIIGPLLALGIALLYVWTGRRFEQRRVTEFARGAGRRHVLVGAGIGTGLAALSLGILALFGAYRITGWGSIASALTVVGIMCAVAVAEEVFFRGVVFRLLDGRWGTVIALGASSLLFGLVHLLNPGATLWGAIAIAVEAGLLLGAAYVVTGTLWLAIGIHFGWNLAIVGIFGTAVSGTESQGSLVTAVTAGPGRLTGGGFGPEASVVSVLVCTAATAAMLLVARRRGRLHLRRR